MSKRFGRNQKRAMRAEIKTANELLKEADLKVKRLRADALGAQQTQREMRDALDRTARLLGDHFAGLPPVVNAIGNMRLPDDWRMTTVDATTAFTPNRDMAYYVSHAIHSLEVMKASALVDELRQQLHVRLVTPDGQLGYAVSLSAYYRMTDRELLNEIALMIAQEMAIAIKGGQNASRPV